MPRPAYYPPLVTSSRFPLKLAQEQDRVPVVDAEWGAFDFAEESLLRTLDLGGVMLAFHGDDAGLGSALDAQFPTYVRAGVVVDPIHISLRAVDRQPFPTPVAFVSSAERDGRVLAKLRGLSALLDLDGSRVVARVERRCLAQELANLARFCLWAYAPLQRRFLLHAAAIEVDGEAILVVGTAQSGKSTVARLAAPRRVLTDDVVLVWIADDRLRAATVGLVGSEGSEGLERHCVRRELPVRAIVTLNKGVGNRLAPLGPARATLELQCAMTLLSSQPALRAQSLELAEAAVRRVRRFALTFAPTDDSFWALIEQSVR